MKISTIQDVVDWRLCLGCGACAHVSGGTVRMENRLEAGFRPRMVGTPDSETEERMLGVCPGLHSQPGGEGANGSNGAAGGGQNDGLPGLGPVLEVWEGHASDPDTRFRGSSGGALTALARFALEREGYAGVLHVGSDPDKPLENRAVFSTSHEELLARTGSRYAPASVCEHLDRIARADGPCAFIGQPSEVAALRMVQKVDPEVDRRLGIALSFYCAGSPATLGTETLLARHGIDPAKVTSLRYRGNGWPGMFSVMVEGEDEPVLEMTYAESWAFIQAFRPWSTHIWPDGGGESADISCGDPWHKKPRDGDRGSSLVVVRTERGRRFLRAAMEAGYLELEPSTREKAFESQRNLMNKKGAIWGRLATMRMLGIPTPEHRDYDLFPLWARLPVKDKLRSTVGTARRIITRKYLRKAPGPSH